MNFSVLHETKEKLVERIENYHLKNINNSDGKVFYISDLYPGVWLEHVYDGIVWADYKPSDNAIADNYVRLFLKNQKQDGQLPCYVWEKKIGYSQVQECVSIGSLCLEAVDRNPNDKSLLNDSYNAIKKWDEWLCKNRMTLKTGLIETFCGFDDGHDNSGRHNDFKYEYKICEDASVPPTDDNILPVIAPDMNAVFYGNRVALSKMAERLGLLNESIEWNKKAAEVKEKIFNICFDENDLFFYDIDKNGIKRPIRSISVTSLFCEKVLEKNLADVIFEKHLHNPKEFWTPYPFPSVAINDPAWIQNKDGNSWGFYSQGLTVLRTLRWMEHYGKHKEMEELMDTWIKAWVLENPDYFGQELHPVTGKPSTASPYYSSCMLYILTAMKKLYEIEY